MTDAHARHTPPGAQQPERATVWRPSTLPGSELLHAHYVHQRFVPHMHDQLALGVVEYGAYTYRYRGAEHIAGSGDIVACNPGEVHTGHTVTADGWTYRMFYFDLDTLRDLVTQITDQPGRALYFPATVMHDPALAAQLRTLHRATTQPHTLRLAHDTRLLATVAQLIQRHAEFRPAITPTGSEPEPVARAKAYIDAHYAHPITLDTLAGIACLSPYYLARVFHDQIGLPPHAYQLQRRVQAARALLAAGCSVADTAVEVGFFDQSHLTRHFVRMIGVTPGRYRRMVRRSPPRA